MFDTFRTGDLVAGIVAAAVFIGLFAILGVTPIASVPLAVVAYPSSGGSAQRALKKEKGARL